MSSPKSNKVCCNVGCKKSGTFSCSGCKMETYCSRECQINHWDVHKSICKSRKNSGAAARSPSPSVSIESLSVKQLKHIIRSKVNDYPTAERKSIIDEMNKMIEREPLAALAEKHVQPGEVTSLLSTLQEKSGGGGAMMSSGGGRGKGMKQVVREQEVDMSKASPRQLREQAAMLRRNPAMVRKQQPAMAHMSDAEIFEAADQLEQMANNPNMMKEFRENWEKLSPEEREQMKNITPEQREQIKNMTPEQREMMQNITPEQKKEMMKLAHMTPAQKKNLQVFQEGITGTIDAKWVDAVVSLLKSKPEVFKTMFKSMSPTTPDAEIDPYLEFVVGMGEWAQRAFLNVVMYVQMASKPAMRIYNTVDSWTYGNAKHIAMLLAGLVLYIFVLFMFFIARHMFAYGSALFMFLYKLAYGNAAAANYQSTATASSSAAAVGASAGGIPAAEAIFDAAATAQGMAAAGAGAAAAGGADEFEF